MQKLGQRLAAHMIDGWSAAISEHSLGRMISVKSVVLFRCECEAMLLVKSNLDWWVCCIIVIFVVLSLFVALSDDIASK